MHGVMFVDFCNHHIPLLTIIAYKYLTNTGRLEYFPILSSLYYGCLDSKDDASVTFL